MTAETCSLASILSDEEMGITVFTKTKIERTEQDITFGASILKNFPFFASMQRDDLDLDQLLAETFKKMKCQNFNQGDIIFHHKDPAVKFYLIIEGSVDIYIPKTEEEISEEIQKVPKPVNKKIRPSFMTSLKTLQNGPRFDTANSLPKTHNYFVVHEGQIICKYKMIRNLRPGAHFGEIALLQDCDRSATVVAASDLKVATLSKKVFKKVSRHFDQDFQAKIAFFAKLMHRNPDPSVTRFCYGFQERQYSYGQKIYTQGSMPTEFFIVKQGQVQLSMPEVQEKSASIILPSLPKIKKLPLEKIATLGPFSILGFSETLEHKPYELTATSYSNQTVLYVITRKEFKSLRNRYSDVFNNFAEKNSTRMSYFENRVETISTIRNLSLDSNKLSKMVTQTSINDINQLHSPKSFEKRLEKVLSPRTTSIGSIGMLPRLQILKTTSKDLSSSSPQNLLIDFNLNNLNLTPKDTPSNTNRSPRNSHRESAMTKDSIVFPEPEIGSFSHRVTAGQDSARFQRDNSLNSTPREYSMERTLKILAERAEMRKNSCSGSPKNNGPRPGMFFKKSTFSSRKIK